MHVTLDRGLRPGLTRSGESPGKVTGDGIHGASAPSVLGTDAVLAFSPPFRGTQFRV